jgi:phosphoribosylaminoimidazole carboxylase (NCAIR synthetase)
MTGTSYLPEGFPRVGVIGADEHARMLQQAAFPLGIGLRLLATANGCALQHAADAVVIEGADADRVRSFAAGLDVITWSGDAMPELPIDALVSTGVPVRPGVQPAVGTGVGIPAGSAFAVPAVRSPHGQVVLYAPTRIITEDGLPTAFAAAALAFDPDTTLAAQRATIALAGDHRMEGAFVVHFDATGTRIVDVVACADITATWTVDGAGTSLYENHLRAVLDLPLGAPTLRGGRIVTVPVLGLDATEMFSAFRHCMARDPSARLHLYGKDVIRGGTIGHVTVVAEDQDDALRRARHAAEYLSGSIEE